MATEIVTVQMVEDLQIITVQCAHSLRLFLSYLRSSWKSEQRLSQFRWYRGSTDHNCAVHTLAQTLFVLPKILLEV